MSGNLPLNPLYTWGDFVKIKEISPSKYEPGKLGSICGIWTINSPVTSHEYEMPFGTVMYTIEFEDGNAIEIPEDYLDRYVPSSM